MKKRILLALVIAPVLQAAQPPAAVSEAVQRLAPDFEIDSVQPAPFEGFYEVRIGASIIYVSADGAYLLEGRVFDTRRKIDLTEQARAGLRAEALSSIDDAETVLFAADDAKHTVTVFTDVDCGYCRLLHQQMAKYNDLGISVRYVAFPRSGLEAESFKKAEAVWCAEDRQVAMTRAKAGESVKSRECDTPIEEQFELGRAIGVSGTPAIYTERGMHLGGYLEPAALQARLEQLEAAGS